MTPFSGRFGAFNQVMKSVSPHGAGLRYRVIRQMVVEPDQLWVLDSSQSAGLTSITCYPFDYVGPAPRRFIVHAERMASVSERSDTTVTQEDDTR